MVRKEDQSQLIRSGSGASVQNYSFFKELKVCRIPPKISPQIYIYVGINKRDENPPPHPHFGRSRDHVVVFLVCETSPCLAIWRPPSITHLIAFTLQPKGCSKDYIAKVDFQDPFFFAVVNWPISEFYGASVCTYNALF
jgi:hypothetical protein